MAKSSQYWMWKLDISAGLGTVTQICEVGHLDFLAHCLCPITVSFVADMFPLFLLWRRGEGFGSAAPSAPIFLQLWADISDCLVVWQSGCLTASCCYSWWLSSSLVVWQSGCLTVSCCYSWWLSDCPVVRQFGCLTVMTNMTNKW